MKYKHIVFDLDGTLLDTEYAILRSLQETVKTVTGNLIELSELTFALGITGVDALKKLNIGDVPSVLGLWIENMNKYSDSILVFEGIAELLDTLTKCGYELGIVTSKTRKEFEHDFIQYDIHKYFSRVICSDDTSEHKPSPVPLLKYMESTKTSCEELLYIGDSIYDMNCANNAKVDFALAEWGSIITKKLSETYRLSEPLDLLSVIN